MTDAERLRQFVTYDPATGLFGRIVCNRGTKPGSNPALKHPGGYLEFRFGRSHQLAHRLAWLHFYGCWPDGEVDHINGDRTDNRIANLRVVTRSGNAQNIRAAHADSTLGLLGVTLRPSGRFAATIAASGKRFYLGTFDTADEAARRYLSAKRELHSGCTI